MNPDDVELCMGHEIPYGSAYHDRSNDELMKEYRKHEQTLFIGSDQVVRETLENVGTDMARLRDDNLALRDEMQKMRKMIVTLSTGGLIMEDVKDQNLQ